MTKQHHTIEIFSASCPLCKHITDDIQIGKCEGCNQVVYDINNMTEEIKQKMKTYGIKSVPTTIIDGEVKAVVESRAFLRVADIIWINLWPLWLMANILFGGTNFMINHNSFE